MSLPSSTLSSSLPLVLVADPQRIVVVSSNGRRSNGGLHSVAGPPALGNLTSSPRPSNGLSPRIVPKDVLPADAQQHHHPHPQQLQLPNIKTAAATPTATSGATPQDGPCICPKVKLAYYYVAIATLLVVNNGMGTAALAFVSLPVKVQLWLSPKEIGENTSAFVELRDSHEQEQEEAQSQQQSRRC